MTKRVYLIVLLISMLSGCESDIDADSRIRAEFSAAIEVSNFDLAKEKILEYRDRRYGWEYGDLSARLAMNNGDWTQAKKVLSSCGSSKCGLLRKELKEKEYKKLMTDGLAVQKYSPYIDHFIVNWKDSKVDMCNALNFVENNQALANIDNRLEFSKVLRGKIIASGHDVYNKSGYVIPAYIERTNIDYKNGKIKEDKGHMTMDEQAMIFQIAQKRGYMLGHEMLTPEFKPTNLAQLGALRSRVFRNEDESPCDYINRSLREKKFGSTDIVNLPDGERVYLRTTGIEFDNDVVKYHALIARYNDVFKEYETIEEKIYLSETEVSDNKVPVEEVIQ